MEEIKAEHNERIRGLELIYKTRGLNSAEIKSFLDGIKLDDYVNASSSVLEIGCGAGNFLRDIKNIYGAECYGIDKFPVRSEKNVGIKIMEADAENIPTNSNSFDFIFSYFTFPYIPDKLGALSEAYRVLKPNGTAIIDFDTLDVDRQDNSRLVDKYLRPSFDHIMDVYISNRGRVCPDRVNIFAENGNQARRSRRVILKKTDDKPLHFPKLKTFVVNSSIGFPTTTSYY